MRPTKKVAIPINVNNIKTAAHEANKPGLAKTQRQLTSTACQSLTCLSNNKGIEIALDANMGAANKPPNISHNSKAIPLSASTTCKIKSFGVLMGWSVTKVIKAAELNTQAVAAAPNKIPKRIKHQ